MRDPSGIAEPVTSSVSECRPSGSGSILIAVTWAYARCALLMLPCLSCAYPRGPWRSRAVAGPSLGPWALPQPRSRGPSARHRTRVRPAVADGQHQDLLFTSWRKAAGRGARALLAAAVAVHLRPRRPAPLLHSWLQGVGAALAAPVRAVQIGSSWTKVLGCRHNLRASRGAADRWRSPLTAGIAVTVNASRGNGGTLRLTSRRYRVDGSKAISKTFPRKRLP